MALRIISKYEDEDIIECEDSNYYYRIDFMKIPDSHIHWLIERRNKMIQLDITIKEKSKLEKEKPLRRSFHIDPCILEKPNNYNCPYFEYSFDESPYEDASPDIVIFHKNEDHFCIAKKTTLEAIVAITNAVTNSNCDDVTTVAKAAATECVACAVKKTIDLTTCDLDFNGLYMDHFYIAHDVAIIAAVIVAAIVTGGTASCNSIAISLAKAINDGYASIIDVVKKAVIIDNICFCDSDVDTAIMNVSKDLLDGIITNCIDYYGTAYASHNGELYSAALHGPLFHDASDMIMDTFYHAVSNGNDIITVIVTIITAIYKDGCFGNRKSLINALAVVNIYIDDIPVADIQVADIPVADIPVADIPVADIPVADIPVNNVVLLANEIEELKK